MTPPTITKLDHRPIELADHTHCYKNGLLPVVLSEPDVDRLFVETHSTPGYALSIDLDRQMVVAPDGESFHFEIASFRKFCMLNGFDDIGLTLRYADKIKAFEAVRLSKMPWLSKRVA